jgi:hypothetical protein
MARDGIGAIDRRLAIGGGLAVAASLPFARAQRISRVIIQRGAAGGGLVQFADGEARFSLAASRMTTTEEGVESEPVFLGHLVWRDDTVGYTLETSRITNYENLLLDTEEGRMIEGVLTVTTADGELVVQDAPFTLEVRFERPDSAPDHVTFNVGVAADGGVATPGSDEPFTYTADGDVVGGILDADFAVNPDTGEISEPEEQ